MQKVFKHRLLLPQHRFSRPNCLSNEHRGHAAPRCGSFSTSAPRARSDLAQSQAAPMRAIAHRVASADQRVPLTRESVPNVAIPEPSERWQPAPSRPKPATAAPRRTRRRRTPLGASVRHPPRQRRPRPLGARRPPSEASTAWLEVAAALVPADRGHRRGRKRRPGSAQAHRVHSPISRGPKPHPWGPSRTGSQTRINVCP